MSEKEFTAAIVALLKKKLTEGTDIKLQKVRKNNNVILQGLLIQKPNSNISPTIYMEAFYEMYENGYPLEEIAERILTVYEKGKVKGNIDMEFFRDFEQVKERIVYRLINAEQNRELLKGIPHILFLDLAICFYYAFYNEELGDGMILIHNNHMELWGSNHQELMKLAQKNTCKLFPPVFITLDSIMQNMYEYEEFEAAPVRFYVLTNKQKTQGAACILYPQMLEQVAGKLGGGFYVIPSSIHEMIVLRGDGEEDVGFLQEIIKEANKTQLTEEEILSDHPYYYDVSLKKLVSKKIF